MNIQKNIEITDINGRTGAPRKYPFADMDVGDSIFFEGEKLSSSCRPYLAAQQIARNHGMKFSGRTVDGGVRIWRIA